MAQWEHGQGCLEETIRTGWWATMGMGLLEPVGLFRTYRRGRVRWVAGAALQRNPRTPSRFSGRIQSQSSSQED